MKRLNIIYTRSVLLCLLLLLAWSLFSCRTTAGPVLRHDLPVTALSISTTDKPELYVSAGADTPFKMTTDIIGWQALDPAIGYLRITLIKASPFAADEIYLGTKGNGLFKSLDGGYTWQAINQGLTNTSISDIVFDPEQREKLYLLTSHGGIFKSDNSGLTWRSSNAGISFGKDLSAFGINKFYQLLLVDDDSPVLFAGHKFGLYRKSLDVSSWDNVTDFEGTPVESMTYDVANDVIYVVRNHLPTRNLPQQLYRSLDKGKTWSATGEPLQQQFATIGVNSDGSALYAGIRGAQHGILKSVDGGITWRSVSSGLPAMDVTAMAFDPNDGSIVYAGLWGGGVYKSTDGGRHWKPYNKGIPENQKRRPGNSPMQTGTSTRDIPIPESFRKCNVCHGWRDPVMESVKNSTFSFYVTGTPRLWSYTVIRMNEEEKFALGPTHPEVLTQAEEEEVIDFLNRYFSHEK